MTPLRHSLRLACAGLGVLCLIVGLIGVVVPLLPTTPLVILAAFLFSRSNDRLHDWLLRQPVLGPAILDWRRDRAIGWKAKTAATVMVGVGVGASVALAPLPLWAASFAVAIAVAALGFVLTRPAPGGTTPASFERLPERYAPNSFTPERGSD